jgi:microcystin-dependent protein
MAQPFIGDIRMFGGTFAPSGYATCSGQTIAISQNPALFSLLGTTYGGDGVTTFNLPDLRGRVPVHVGSGFVQGQVGGSEAVTLNGNQIPPHHHSAGCTDGNANQAGPGNNRWATEPNGITAFYTELPPDATMHANLVGLQPNETLPHSNLQPYLAVNFIIALFGVFPARN